MSNFLCWPYHAAIANAALHDFGIITEEDKTNVTDRTEIRRASSTNWREFINDSGYNEITENRGLFFHGRRQINCSRKEKK